MYPVLAMTYTKFPKACKALDGLHAGGGQLQSVARGGEGLSHSVPQRLRHESVWTADPKTTLFRDVAKRTRTAGGLGSVGEKAATAISDFIVVDMFANYCTGREDVKGAISIAERQLKRIYR